MDTSTNVSEMLGNGRVGSHCPRGRNKIDMKKKGASFEDEDDDSSYHGSPPSTPTPLRKRQQETILVVHNTGNVWHGMRLDGGR